MAFAVLPLVFGSGWVLFCLAFVEYWEVQGLDRNLILFGDPLMPGIGDKKLVQLSATRGVEVLLLRRSNEAVACTGRGGKLRVPAAWRSLVAHQARREV